MEDGDDDDDGDEASSSVIDDDDILKVCDDADDNNDEEEKRFDRVNAVDLAIGENLTAVAVHKNKGRDIAFIIGWLDVTSLFLSLTLFFLPYYYRFIDLVVLEKKSFTKLKIKKVHGLIWGISKFPLKCPLYFHMRTIHFFERKEMLLVLPSKPIIANKSRFLKLRIKQTSKVTARNLLEIGTVL